MPWFKRSYRGLYGNKTIGFGNKVSFAENKTRRTWKPNVQTKTLWSETLKKRFKCRVTTHVLRCIRKAGGFDEYLLKSKDTDIKYPRAIEFKYRIKEAKKAGTQVDEELQSLNLIDDEPSISEPGLHLREATKSAESITKTPLRNTAPTHANRRGLLEILDF